MTMTDEGTAAPDELEADPELHEFEPTKPAAKDRWWTSIPTLLLVALAWLVVIGAVLAWQRGNDLQAAQDDHQDAARVAGDFTTAVLSYDYHDLSGSLDDVLALSSPEWGEQYENAWFSDQQPVIEELQAVAQVDVRDVMLGDEHDDAVSAVVLFNASIESQIGTRRLSGSYLRLDLVKVDGDWRVDNLAFLATTDQSLDPATETGGGQGQGGGQGGGNDG
jgi:hypothetical protein